MFPSNELTGGAILAQGAEGKHVRVSRAEAKPEQESSGYTKSKGTAIF